MASDQEHEDVIDGQFDLELTRRLLVFIRPYWRTVAWSVLFMLVGVLMGLAFPMITKMAIDDYLARLHQIYRAPTIEQAAEVAGRFPAKYRPVFLDPKTLAVADRAINQMDPRKARILRKDAALEPAKYYLFPASACPPEMPSPRLQGGHWLVQESELKQVPVRQLMKIRQADWDGIVWLTLAALLIAILNLLADYYHVLLLSKAGQAAMADLRTKVFAHLESLSLDYFNKHPMGRLVTRVTNDVGALNDLLTTVLVQFFRDVLMLAGSVAVLLWLDAELALITMLTIPLFVFATLFFKVKLRDIYRQSRLYLSSLNAHLAEDISGFKIIQIFRQAGRRRREYEEVNDNYFRSTFREVKWFGVFRPTVEIICAIGIAVVFIYGGGLQLKGAMELGAFVAFITYVDRMFRPLAAMCDKYTIMQSAMAAAERLVAILDEKPKIIEDPNAQPLAAPMAGRVDFEDIHFSYIAGQPILRGVGFSVQPGKSVAIVGPTGAGKSSIISLLCRFYDPDAGAIKIDERDLRSIPFAELRRGIAIVLQDSFIFSRSIRENITMGAGYDDSRVRQAATLVQADEFIENLRHGYDSEMEERGSTLSSGQKQLLCFARALAHDPKILVLDEATSNIDPATEQLIQQAIDTLMKNRTCVIVAHRLSTIRKADEILVLDGGLIIERGSHDELLAKRGAYYNLYLLQYQNH